MLSKIVVAAAKTECPIVADAATKVRLPHPSSVGRKEEPRCDVRASARKLSLPASGAEGVLLQCPEKAGDQARMSRTSWLLGLSIPTRRAATARPGGTWIGPSIPC